METLGLRILQWRLCLHYINEKRGANGGDQTTDPYTIRNPAISHLNQTVLHLNWNTYLFNLATVV